MEKVVIRASYNGDNPSEETLAKVRAKIIEVVQKDLAMSEEEHKESLKKPTLWPFDPIKKVGEEKI